MRTADPITVETTAIDDCGDTRPVTLIYRRDHPYAVHLHFTEYDGTDDGPNVWLLSRDTLALGAMAASDEDGEGDGDVHVWAEDGDVHMRLTSAEGSIELAIPYAAVKRFLDASFRAVPKGRERIGAAINRLIADCLDGAS